MEKFGVAVAAVFGLVVAFLVMMVYTVLAYGFVGQMLWGWFVAPTFELPALTLVQAYGISMLVNMWSYHHNPWKAKDERETAEKIGETVGLLLRPWFVLLIGWTIHCFMK